MFDSRDMPVAVGARLRRAALAAEPARIWQKEKLGLANVGPDRPLGSLAGASAMAAARLHGDAPHRTGLSNGTEDI